MVDHQYQDISDVPKSYQAIVQGDEEETDRTQHVISERRQFWWRFYENWCPLIVVFLLIVIVIAVSSVYKSHNS